VGEKTCHGWVLVSNESIWGFNIFNWCSRVIGQGLLPCRLLHRHPAVLWPKVQHQVSFRMGQVAAPQAAKQERTNCGPEESRGCSPLAMVGADHGEGHHVLDVPGRHVHARQRPVVALQHATMSRPIPRKHRDDTSNSGCSAFVTYPT